MQTIHIIHLYFMQIINLPYFFYFFKEFKFRPSYILKNTFDIIELLFSMKILSVVSEEK